jgi:hypothetical protein
LIVVIIIIVVILILLIVAFTRSGRFATGGCLGSFLARTTTGTTPAANRTRKDRV